MAESEVQNEELQFDSPGSCLRRAREAAGLSLGDIAARTKIAERHLSSIEQDRFSDLASRTYAVGFARAYARTVGLDEGEIALAVREELAGEEVWEAPQPATFEPGDPARVPGSRLAWLAAAGAAIVIAAMFLYWRSYYAPAVSLPELTAEREAEKKAELAIKTPTRAAQPTSGQQGPVVFTALEPAIWVKFYDAQGTQLMQKQMAQGESYTVPADADGPLIRTARPDALQITIGGRVVPKLADIATNIRDGPVSAAALLARGSTPATATQAPAAATAAGQAANAPPRGPSPVARPVSADAAPDARVVAAPAPAPADSPAPPPAAVETSTVSN